MSTPLGWARANLIFEKEPRPKPGSLVELIFLLVFFAKQRAKFTEVRAQTQAAIDTEGDASAKAFDDFQKAFFPYDRKRRMEEYAEQQNQMARWVGGGPVGITPTMLQQGSSPQVARGAQALRERARQEEMGLLQKM